MVLADSDHPQFVERAIFTRNADKQKRPSSVAYADRMMDERKPMPEGLAYCWAWYHAERLREAQGKHKRSKSDVVVAPPHCRKN